MSLVEAKGHIAAVLTGLIVFLTGCSTTKQPKSLSRFEFTQPQMGVPFRIVLYAPDEATAKAAATAAFKHISALNDILSDYETDSELNQLSRTSGQDRWVKVSEHLWTLLRRSQEMARASDGAFDVTVGPCVTLWRKARREKEAPDEKRLMEARAAVGFQKLLLDPEQRAAKLLVPGMKLDLGAIAKGYGVDQALLVLRTNGIRHALVAGAGDLAVSGAPPGSKGWRIELATFDETNGPASSFVFLSHAALATSGDTFQHLEWKGKRYSHILDPRTGVGLTDHSLVTVIAPDCITADSLATAVSVMGPSGMPLVEKAPRVSARILRAPEGKVECYKSERWREN